MEKDKRVLLAQRVEDLPIPYARSYKGKCSECGSEVWIAYSSPQVDLTLCGVCFKPEMAEGVEFIPPTESQIKEVLEIWKKARRPD